MDFEPQKFFVGLIDFFSILLPGALLTFLLKMEIGHSHWATYDTMPAPPELGGAKGWVVFLVVSYLLGHFAFLLASWLDELYDWLRRRTLNEQVTRMLRRRKPLFWWMRLLVWLVFKKERNLAVDRAGKLKQHYLTPLQAQKTINNFQWCKALLTRESPDSLAVVQRFEADSKFFRCFVIVLLFLLPLAIHWHSLKLQIAGLVLLPLATWRFMEQRFKATNYAYWFVISLAQKANVTIDKEAAVDPSLTHAGGIVFWKPWLREVRYLLVESSDYPIKWVLPKGKIEENEEPERTAVREVHEETGVWARICAKLGPQSYLVNGKKITVQVFLMERTAGGFRNDRNRRRKWLTRNQLMKFPSIHAETRGLVEQLANTIHARGIRGLAVSE